MPRAISTTCGNHAAPQAQRGFDPYPTPSCAVTALLDAEPLPHGLWDPCGVPDSELAMTLRARGHHVVATDIAVDGIDFLQTREAPPGVGGICTNPPFSLAADFVMHGLGLVPVIVILERVQFLESQARADLFERRCRSVVTAVKDEPGETHRRCSALTVPVLAVHTRDAVAENPDALKHAGSIGWLQC